jgi:hypothetical protein
MSITSLEANGIQQPHPVLHKMTKWEQALKASHKKRAARPPVAQPREAFEDPKEEAAAAEKFRAEFPGEGLPEPEFLFVWWDAEREGARWEEMKKSNDADRAADQQRSGGPRGPICRSREKFHSVVVLTGVRNTADTLENPPVNFPV